MSQHLNPIEDPQVDLGAGEVKHCRSCWREDIHHNVPIPPFALGFLTVMTLGLILLIRPSRCVCCGRMRLF